MICLLNNTNNQHSKLGTKNCVEVDDDVIARYRTNKQIRFKTTVLRSSRCDYCDVYVLVKETMKIKEAGADIASRNSDARNKQVILKNFPSFTDGKTKINNSSG